VGVSVIPRANVVVALLGHPGSGKLTISRALSPSIGALIVDNHWICNPIFELIEADGITPLKEGVWEQVGKVRDAVMETIATLSPPGKSFIFTFCASEEWPPDHAVLSSIQRTAERREATFVPIRILCAEAELVRRITSRGRKERLKLLDPVQAAELARKVTVIDPRHKNQMTLDTTKLSAGQSAAAIEQHIRALTM